MFTNDGRTASWVSDMNVILSTFIEHHVCASIPIFLTLDEFKKEQRFSPFDRIIIYGIFFNLYRIICILHFIILYSFKVPVIISNKIQL